MPYVTSRGSDGFISLAEARRLLKITHRAMFDLIKTGELDFVIRNEGMALRYLLRLSDVENVKETFERAISSRTLARQLGVDCEAIRRLTNTIKFDADVVKKLLRTRREATGHV